MPHAAGDTGAIAWANGVDASVAAKLDSTTASSTYAPRAIAAGSAPIQATSAGRYVGVTAGGPPTVGTYLTADWVVDQSGTQWVCLGGGTPGTWVCPGTDLFAPVDLVWPNARALDYRNLPGIQTAARQLYPDRAYAMAFPIPLGKTLTSLNVHVTTAGNAGAVLRGGVYANDFGWPGDLIADLGTQPADAIGWKTLTAATPVKGGRFVWVVFADQNSATVAPFTSQLSYSPYFPACQALTGDDATYWACYASIPGAMPTVWPSARNSGANTNYAPYFTAHFGTDTSPTLYVPDRVPVIVPTLASEQTACQEPNVYWDGAQWVMVYSGGWAGERIHYATAPTIDGPWTKHGYVPGAGIANATGRSSVLLNGGTLYVYFDNQVVSGPDITHLGASSVAVALPNGPVTQVTNTSVINDGGTYRMIFDGHGTGDGGYWKSGYATATSPLGPFTVSTFPLVLGPVMNGGPCLTKVGAVFNLWYHGGGGNLPNDIYHATSSDCITWASSTTPVIRRKHRYEVDQIADPFYVTDPSTGTGYLFWDALNNVASASVLMRSVPQAMTIAP